MRCWHGYLYGAGCKWLPCGPADATATPSSVLQKIRNGLSVWYWPSPVVLEKKAFKRLCIHPVITWQQLLKARGLKTFQPVSSSWSVPSLCFHLQYPRYKWNLMCKSVIMRILHEFAWHFVLYARACWTCGCCMSQLNFILSYLNF